MSLTDTVHSDISEENRLLIFFISTVAAIGGFLFGFDSGVINGTVDGLSKSFTSSSTITGFNVASMLLGCAVGAYFGGRIADQFGRKHVLFLTSVFFLVSAWGSGAAAFTSEFVLYRIIGGLAVGAASVITPAYIAEISPVRLRGAFTSIQQIAIILGLFCAFLSNYLLASYAGDSTAILLAGYEAWRWMFWVEIVPALLFLILLFSIPESPRYLILNQRPQEAKRILTRLLGEHEASRVFDSILSSLTKETQYLEQLTRFRAKKKSSSIIWIGIGLAALQQFIGINVIFYYGAILWQAVGFTENDALQINLISGALSLIACIITIKVVDRIGRKPLLLVGAFLMFMSLGMLVLAFANSLVLPTGSLELGSYGTLALVSANLYVFVFNMTWGPVMWVMLGEMFPNQYRGKALGLSGLSQWGANFIVTMTFPLMLQYIGLTFTYSIYALFSLTAFFFVYLFVTETKGKELEMM